MFESDDFDEVLSQFDFPEITTEIAKQKESIHQIADNLERNSTSREVKLIVDQKTELKDAALPLTNIDNTLQSDKQSSKCSNDITEKVLNQSRKENKEDLKLSNFVLPKHTYKRKIINSYFDHQSKRKFPGPAGLLTGTLEVPKDESICQIELLSQDIDYNQHNLERDAFESPLWTRLQSDCQSCKLNIDSINAIKQQALSGNLRQRKAQNVTAFVEAVDRSAVDPLIILRDTSGSIKCTLHRDAWSIFSQYIVSECCAVILQKPTVLTTGGAFKKHYLNITLNNILAIYSSTVLTEEDKTLPDGYNVVYEDDFTVIKTDKSSDSIGNFQESLEQTNGAEDTIEDLDSFFSDVF